MRRRSAADVFQNPHHADHRRGVDRLAQCFVVKTHVAAGDRRAQRFARRRHALDHRGELSHDWRLFRIPKVQAVSRRHWSRAGASHVAGRFRHCVHGAQFGIEIAPAPVAIQRHGQRPLRALDANQSGISTRPLHGVGLHHVLVLLMNPVFGADIRRSQQHLEVCGEVLPTAELDARRHRARYRRLPLFDGALVKRGVIGERLVGNLRHYFAVLQHSHFCFGDDAANFHRIQAPFIEDLHHLALTASLYHQQHALLRLAEHDLVRRHAGFPLRHAIQFDLQPHAAAPAHLAS